MINNNQQPEVKTCQGGGEMFKTCLTHNLTRAVKVGILTRNPPADFISQFKGGKNNE